MGRKRKNVVEKSKEEEKAPVTPEPARISARAKKSKAIFDPSETDIPRKKTRKSDVSPSDKETSIKDEPLSPIKAPPKILHPHVVAETDEETDEESPKQPEVEKIVKKTPPKNKPATSPVSDSDKSAKSMFSCFICHKEKRGVLKTCKKCYEKAHMRCLESDANYSNVPMVDGFVCLDCIDCVVCGGTSKEGELHFCKSCQNAFHVDCHSPKITVKSDSWVCKSCAGDETTSESSVSNASSVKPVAKKRGRAKKKVEQEEFAGFSDTEIKNTNSKPVTSPPKEAEKVEDKKRNEGEEEEEEEEEDDVSIGDDFEARLDNLENVKDWSVSDVFKYFKHYFPNIAHVFKEQEIDGSSLVLMKKSDILSGFGLKVGPAILLHQRIVMMQENSTDVRLTWL